MVYRSTLLTRLAALADTSKSEGSADRVNATVDTSDGESNEMSRRHSVARALRILRVISKALLENQQVGDVMQSSSVSGTYPLERVLPAFALRQWC
jgi:hypothetical protein